MSSQSIGRRAWRSIAQFRRDASRSRVRSALRLAFVGVVLASGAQDPRPFAGEPSGGRHCLGEAWAVCRGRGTIGVRQRGSTGRGDRPAGRGPDPASTLIHEHKSCKGGSAC